jgi:hypothetical protein
MAARRARPSPVGGNFLSRIDSVVPAMDGPAWQQPCKPEQGGIDHGSGQDRRAVGGFFSAVNAAMRCPDLSLGHRV